MKKKKGAGLAGRFIVGVVVAIAVIGGGKAWFWLSDNKLGNVRTDTDLYVYPDTAPEQVLAALDSCIIRPGSLKRVFSEHRVAEYMKPGHYLVKKGQSSAYIARMLNNCWQTPVQYFVLKCNDYE